MLLRWKQRRIKAGFTLMDTVMALTVLVIVSAGMIEGYVQMNRFATCAAWSLAAQSVASQGVEQARGAQWFDLGGIDQFPPTTNSSGAVAPYINTNCSLDVPSTGKLIWVTNYIWIWTVSTYPPLRTIRSDCVWTLPLTGQSYTNTVITLRAPDQ